MQDALINQMNVLCTKLDRAVDVLVGLDCADVVKYHNQLRELITEFVPYGQYVAHWNGTPYTSILPSHAIDCLVEKGHTLKLSDYDLDIIIELTGMQDVIYPELYRLLANGELRDYVNDEYTAKLYMHLRLELVDEAQKCLAFN